MSLGRLVHTDVGCEKTTKKTMWDLSTDLVIQLQSKGVAPMKMAVTTDAMPITKENGSRQIGTRRRTNRFECMGSLVW
jgi:hypothetical protein